MNQFTEGQIVCCTKDGKFYTVAAQLDSEVFVIELCGRHIHAANLRAA